MSARIIRHGTTVFTMYLLGILAGAAAGARGTGGGASFPERMRERRLQAFNMFPLRHVGRSLLSDNIPRTAILMTVVNLNGSLLHLMLGMFYLPPVFAALQGFLVGGMLSLVHSGRAYLFSAVVLPFEAGAFSLAGGLGMGIADRWLLERRGIRRSVAECLPDLRAGLLLVFLLQAVGGLLEAVGAITFKLPGVMTREQIARAVGHSP